MMLDPTIANPATLKLGNPLDDMTTALNNALMMEKMGDARRTRRKSESRNALLKKYTRPDGTIDREGLMYGAAQGDMGEMIPELQEDFDKHDKYQAEIADKQAGIQKTQADTVGQSMKNLVDVLPMIQTPQQYVDFIGKDPVLGPALQQRGMDLNKILAMPQPQFTELLNKQIIGAKDYLKKHYIEVDKGGTGGIYQMPEYGTGAPKQVATWNVTKDPNAGAGHWVQDWQPDGTVRNVPATPGMVTRPKPTPTLEERELAKELAERSRAAALVSQVVAKKYGLRTDVLPGSGDLRVTLTKPLTEKERWMLQKELDGISGAITDGVGPDGKPITKIELNMHTTAKQIRDQFGEILAPKAPKQMTEVELRAKARAQAAQLAKTMMIFDEGKINQMTEHIFQDLMSRQGAGPGGPSLRDELKAGGLL